jgi:hypothetical protein
MADGERLLVMVDQLGRLTQTPVTQEGSLPAFNPFDGNSHVERSRDGGGQCDQLPVL